MPEKYGNVERAALIALMLEDREVPNTELKGVYGIDLRQPERDRLNKHGLIKTRNEGRKLFHKITKLGVHWCNTKLGDIQAPERSGPLPRAVFPLLCQISLNLRKHNLRFADLTGPGDLEALIRAAYDELSDKPHGWVRLAALRARLDGADRSEVDKTLLDMTRTGLVHLAPDSDRRAVTDADRAAAIRVGRDDNHVLAIEES